MAMKVKDIEEKFYTAHLVISYGMFSNSFFFYHKAQIEILFRMQEKVFMVRQTSLCVHQKSLSLDSRSPISA